MSPFSNEESDPLTPPQSPLLKAYDDDFEEDASIEEQHGLAMVGSRSDETQTSLRQTTPDRQRRSRSVSPNTMPAFNHEDVEGPNQAQVYLTNARFTARYRIGFRGFSPPKVHPSTKIRVKLPPPPGKRKVFGPAKRVKPDWTHILTRPAGVQASSSYKRPYTGSLGGDGVPPTKRRKRRDAFSFPNPLSSSEPDPNSQLALESVATPTPNPPSGQQVDTDPQTVPGNGAISPCATNTSTDTTSSHEDDESLRLRGDPKSQLTLEVRGSRPPSGPRKDTSGNIVDTAETDEDTKRPTRSSRRSTKRESRSGNRSVVRILRRGELYGS